MEGRVEVCTSYYRWELSVINNGPHLILELSVEIWAIVTLTACFFITFIICICFCCIILGSTTNDLQH